MLPQFLAALLLLTLTGVVRAGEPVVINGAGDAARDVPAVQAAVDRGGAVVLEGALWGKKRRRTMNHSTTQTRGGKR